MFAISKLKKPPKTAPKGWKVEIGQNFTKWCKTINSKDNFNIFGAFWKWYRLFHSIERAISECPKLDTFCRNYSCNWGTRVSNWGTRVCNWGTHKHKSMQQEWAYRGKYKQRGILYALWARRIKRVCNSGTSINAYMQLRHICSQGTYKQKNVLLEQRKA